MNAKSALMQIIYNKDDCCYETGYILDDEDCPSVIILKKEGGKKSMEEQTIVKVKEGFESVYAELKKLDENCEADIQKAFAERKSKIQKMITDCTYTEVVLVKKDENESNSNESTNEESIDNLVDVEIDVEVPNTDEEE